MAVQPFHQNIQPVSLFEETGFFNVEKEAKKIFLFNGMK
jgi:hypothetical protein